MNKAFVREPDQVDSRCPRCDSAGHPVGPQTLAAWVSSEARRGLAESAYFCPDGQCEVVYYDDFGGIVERGSIANPIPIKDVEAPLCSCFGLTREDVEQDVEEGGVARTRAAVLRAQSDEARCTTLAPNGRTCVPEVQGYYLKCKSRG
ncbi:MAG: hypothetical protein JSS49_02475 [Planctomycetes bacterium]|nr:hypothetical protein [Planctomycetota bacterium]